MARCVWATCLEQPARAEWALMSGVVSQSHGQATQGTGVMKELLRSSPALTRTAKQGKKQNF